MFQYLRLSVVVLLTLSIAASASDVLQAQEVAVGADGSLGVAASLTADGLSAISASPTEAAGDSAAKEAGTQTVR